MSIRWKCAIGFVFFLAFALGAIVDRLIKVYPYLQLDAKIGILDVASLLVTITIAVMIPFLLDKFIEDKKGIKSLLIEELKELIAIVENAKSIISEAHSAGVLTPEDKDKILNLFHEAEIKAGSFEQQVEIGFKHKYSEIKKSVDDLLFDYKDFLTGGELMNSGFIKVENSFLRQNNTEYSTLETGLKVLIQKIYRF